MRRCLAAALLGLGLASAPAFAIAPRGCLQAPGVDRGCSETAGLDGAAAAAVSPDGRHVYVAGNVEEHGVLLTFARDPATGALTRQGCIADNTRDGCVRSEALFAANDVVISADGATVYVLGVLPGSVGVFRRDRQSGGLTEIQCFQAGYSSPTCPLTPFENAWKMALTADGTSLIVAGSHLTRFAVDAEGLLSDAVEQTISGVRNPGAIAVGPDPRRVFVAGGTSESGKISVLARNPATGALTAHDCAGDGTSTGRRCTPADGVHAPADLAVTADGKGVYLAASAFTSSRPADPFSFSGTLHSSALSVLSPARGAQKGCVLFAGRIGERGRCRRAPRARGPGFAGAAAIAVAPNGRTVVAAFDKSSAVAVLRRNPRTQALVPVAGKAGCVRDPSHPTRRARLPQGCLVGAGIHKPNDIAISPDGRHAYVTTPGGLSIYAL